LTIISPVYAIETSAVVAALLSWHEFHFADAVRVVSLTPGSSWKFIAGLVNHGIAGGRTYDELILAAVLRAGATHLITLNPRHFDTKQIDLVVPGG